MNQFPLVALLMWAVLSLNGCSTVALTHSKVANNDFYAEIPLIYEDDVPRIDVNIEGKTYRFAIVAGLHYSSIDPKVLAALKDKKTRWTRIDGQRVPMVTLDELQIGGVSFMGASMLVFDISSWANYTCKHLFDGFIGDNILRNAVWQFDYLGGQLRLASDARRMRAPTGFAQYAALQVNAAKGTPQVALRFESNLDQEVTIQTGEQAGLQLPMAVSRQVRHPGALRPVYHHYGDCDLVDTTYNYSPDQLLLGGQHLIIGPEVSFSNRVEASLGNRFLRHYVFTLDYLGKALWLERQPDAPKYDDTSCQCGFGFTFHQEQWIINHLISGTVAAEVLHIGDELLSLNEQSFAQISWSNYCEIDWEAFRAASPNLVVVVRREGKDLTFVLPQESWFVKE